MTKLSGRSIMGPIGGEGSAAKGEYWAALDGLRALAVLFVLLYHFGAPLGTGGYLGVDVFFVISGCVITASFQRSRARGQGVFDFLWRRAARLLPNLVALAVVALAWDTWREHSLFSTHNAAVLEGLLQVYDVFLTDTFPTPHLWSLSVEWQFYLALPLILPMILSHGTRSGARRALVFSVLSLTSKPLLLWLGMSLLHIYFWPFTRFDEFMLGVAVALFLAQRRALTSGVLATIAMSVLLAAMLFVPLWWSEPRTSLFIVMPLAAGCTFVTVWFVTSAGASGGMSRVLAAPVLRYFGERSYSIYLWHYFIGGALIASGMPTPAEWVGPSAEAWHGPLVFTMQMLATLVVAIAAYEAIERPGRRYFNRQPAWFGVVSRA